MYGVLADGRIMVVPTVNRSFRNNPLQIILIFSIAWCTDFLRGGWNDQGTCCRKDEQIFFHWCLDPAHLYHPYYRDPSSNLVLKRLGVKKSKK